MTMTFDANRSEQGITSPKWRSVSIRYVAFVSASWLLAGVAWAFDSSMTVMAPDMITDKTRAEARVSIRNEHNSPQTYSLEMYVDTPLGRQTLSTEQVAVPANGQVLRSSWFSTQGLAGSNTVHYRVTDPNSFEQSGQHSLNVVASQTRAVPLVTAAWFDPGAVLPFVYPSNRTMNAQDVRNEVNDAHAVGVDTLIISYSEYVLNGWGSFYPSENFSSAASFDVIGTILDQASQNGQRVFVGLGRGNDLYLTWNGFNDPARNAAALAHDTLVAGELWDRYANEPSFYGWYIAHEANEIGPASAAYYNHVVDMLRTFEADKPVLISPAGTPVVSPTILSNSKVDVLAYQDAVGAGYVPYEYTYDPQQRIEMLHDVYSSYAAAHAGTDKHLWTNLENWQMNGPNYTNAYPADISRVLTQLDIEKLYVDVISSYEWFGFMENSNSTVNMWGQRAKNLYTGYRNYYQQVLPSLKTINYAVNSGFEAGELSNGETPEGWTFSGNGTTQRLAYSTDTPTATSAAINLQIDEATGLPWLIQDVSVTGGYEYQFSSWVKQLAADPSGGWLAAQVWMLADENSATILASTALIFDANDWEYQASLITAPDNATIARIILAAQNSSFGVGSGSYLIDGVALVGAAAPGDYNADGAVDQLDYQLWKDTFGSTTESRADGNGDGTIDGADYVFWRDRVTQNPLSGSTSGSTSYVPEPSIFATFIPVLFALSVAVRRRFVSPPC